MGRELVDKHMDNNNNNKPNSFTTSSTGSSDNHNHVQDPSIIEPTDVKEYDFVGNDDSHQSQQVRTTSPPGSSDSKKKLSSSSSYSRGSANVTVPKPFSLSAEKPVTRKSGVDNDSSGNTISRNSSPGSRGSQPSSPLPVRKTSNPKKQHDEEDSYSVASSSVTSIRSNKPKLTVGVAPTFRSTERLERRKEFYQKLEEKQKALEEEKRENEKRLKEEQEVVTKQIRKNMSYKANPVPNFYYEAPPPKLPLKKFPLTRPKSPNLNRRKSCSDTTNQDAKGKHFVRHRHSAEGCKEEPKLNNNGSRTPSTRKSTKDITPKISKSSHDGEKSENDIDG
ncbi:unnamed protein product [Cochlearia groenlandica]